MAGKFNWDDEDDSVSEYDLVEEAQEVEELAAQHAQEPVIVEADEDEIEEILEEAAFDLNEEEANIVYNTRIRLEQAKLYEMLINHPLFEGVDADSRAVAIVQNELKHYVVKRLEILMGMRQPASRAQSEFNTIESDFLRQLAAKGTNGRSLEDDEDYEEELPRSRSSGLKPFAHKIKSSELKPIVKKKKVVQVEESGPQPPPRRKPDPRKKSVARKKAAAPQSRAKKKTQQKVKINNSGGKRDLRPNEIDALAKADIENMKGRTPIHKLKGQARIDEIKEVNERNAKPRPNSGILPHMDENALQMKYMTEQSHRAGGLGKKNQFSTIMANIANKIAVEKTNEDE